MSATEKVIIVGAGPVGLTCAVALSRSGIPVCILEAHHDLQLDLRATSFHPATLDFLSEFGIVDDLVALGRKAPTWQFRDRETGPVATFHMSILREDDTRHPFRLQCEQWKLARRLKEILDEMGVPVEFGARVEAVEQGGDDVALHLGGKRKGETLHAEYVIGADGAYSRVRESLALPFDGFTYPELFLIASTPYPFERDFPDLADINYISDPNEWLIMMHVPGVWRVNIPVSVEGDWDEKLSDKSVQGMLNRVLPRPEPYEIRHRTLYHVHQKVARSFRHGRVALVGDAAHLNNPIGGMGMNGGIHDAFNLTRKLVRIFAGEDDALLDQYDRQRRTVTNEAVQAHTIRNHKILSDRDPEKRKETLDELRRIAADPTLSREYLLKTSMIESVKRANSIR